MSLDYLSELLKVIEATIKFLFETLLQFTRFVAVPLLLSYGIIYLLFKLTGDLSSHINGRLPLSEYTTPVLRFLSLNALILLLVWFLNKGYKFVDTLQSIFTTNT